MSTAHGEFITTLLSDIRAELERFGLEVEGRGERRLAFGPAGLEMWLKLSQPVDTGASTVVWATFEVPVLSHLEEGMALQACAALNHRSPYLAATAAEDLITFVGRELFYVGSPHQDGVRSLVRRALLVYQTAQNVAALVVEGFWDGAKGARPVGATREELWGWVLDEAALGEGAGEAQEAGPIVTRMLEGLGLRAVGPRWGVDLADAAVYGYAGRLLGLAPSRAPVLVRVDLSGDRDTAAGGVRVDVGGVPVATDARPFQALNELNLHAMLKEQPPAGAGAWVVVADRLWYSQALPPALASRNSMLDAVTNGVELCRQSSDLVQQREAGPSPALRSLARPPADLGAGRAS